MVFFAVEKYVEMSLIVSLWRSHALILTRLRTELTCEGEQLSLQEWMSLQNMLYGPHLEIFLSLPITDSSE